MVVETKLGKISGVDMGDYVEYRGVPYAKPPVGELRFKAPQEMDAWDGVYQADTFRAKAMQVTNEDPLYTKEFYSDKSFERPCSEDCLYINIWVPKEKKDGKLPVAFWIHGGAFLGGYSSEQEFDGAAYCKRGVILVSVEYRCNIFGFLALPELTAESELGVSGNYGILDQIAALIWVYDNIQAFGGDPQNITVFGQSAGAMSAQTLVTSPLTGDMISKAILQSGGGYAGGLNRDDITLERQEKWGQKLLEIAGVSTVKELREMPEEKLMGYMDAFLGQVFPEAGGLFLVPNIDGYVLEDGYDPSVEQGKIKDIPYILGTTKDDILVTPELKEAGEFSSLYKGCIAFSEKLEKLGRNPAWVYYFTRDLPGDSAGAFHSAELWYTFGTLGRCWRPMTEGDVALSERMLDYWTNFMKTGNPNGEGLDEWKACSGSEKTIMQFDVV